MAIIITRNRRSFSGEEGTACMARQCLALVYAMRFVRTDHVLVRRGDYRIRGCSKRQLRGGGSSRVVHEPCDRGNCGVRVGRVRPGLIHMERRRGDLFMVFRRSIGCFVSVACVALA